MTPTAQPGAHPDPDLLNAFAERALPEADRVRVMGHLAECARCREIAYLAHAAAEEELIPAPSSHPHPHPGWLSAAFARWRVALIPAAALAAVGAVVLWVQLHPAPRPVEMAQLANPRPQLALESSPPGSRPGPPSQKSHQPDATAPAPSAAAAQTHRLEHARDSLPKLAAPPPSPQDQAARTGSPPATGVPAPNELSRAQRGIHLDGHSAALAKFGPPPDSPAASPYPPAQQPSMVSPENRAAVMAPAPVPPSPGLLNVHGELVAPPLTGSSQVAVQSLQQAELAPEPMNGLPLLRLAKRASLPSGLNTISSAVLLNRLVAIDSAGAVFLSQDGGKRWEPVRQQWSGKAIEVQAPPQLAYRLMSTSEKRNREMPPNPAQAAMKATQENTANLSPTAPPDLTVSSSPASSSRAKAALPGPPLLFQLVTDHHKVWVSHDGKTWREQ